MAKKSLGTIRFVDSPWPEGHAIKTMRWAGHLDPKTGVWFDLDLLTEDYDDDEDENEDEDGGDWASKMVWQNYGSCLISSLKWEGEHSGFLVGTRKAPLDFAALGKRRFSVDPAPVPKKAAFGLYLFGHNRVGANDIRFTPAKKRFQAALAWSAKLALTDGGGPAKLKHSFSATIPSVVFEGFQVKDKVSKEEAQATLAACVRDSDAFTFTKRKGKLWAVPGQSATRRRSAR